MSGPAVRGLELEGGLSALTLQLTKVKRLKEKKISEEDHQEVRAGPEQPGTVESPAVEQGGCGRQWRCL